MTPCTFITTLKLDRRAAFVSSRLGWRSRISRSFLASLLLVLIILVGCASGNTTVPGRLTGETVPSPQVIGPVAGRPVTTSALPLSPAGYTEREYFLRGTANSYLPAGTWSSDGRWGVVPAQHATYETRMLVRRPTNPARFNGTVIVEWLDAPGGRDGDPEFLWEHEELLRAGFAWVGVTTDGIVGQPASIPQLKAANPTRYAPLLDPGINFAYSIFSQAAQSLLHPRGVNPLGPLQPQALIADGDSGAAHSLVTYANAIQPIDQLFNGFLIHSRGSNAAAIAQGYSSPANVDTRSDLPLPVLTVESESEILAPGVPALNYFPVTQADSAFFRLWEVAGTAHVDASLLRLNRAANAAPMVVPCALPPNDGQESFVMDSALFQLTRWVRERVPAMHAPRIEVRNEAIVRDQYGNGQGGIRTPALQVPIATLSGTGNSSANGAVNPGGIFTNPCLLVGTTRPFNAAQLLALYPTHADYVTAVTRAVAGDVTAGVLLPFDASQIEQEAKQAPIPPINHLIQ